MVAFSDFCPGQEGHLGLDGGTLLPCSPPSLVKVGCGSELGGAGCGMAEVD